MAEGDVFRERFKDVFSEEGEKALAKTLLLLNEKALEKIALELDLVAQSGDSGFREYANRDDLKRIAEKRID